MFSLFDSSRERPLVMFTLLVILGAMALAFFYPYIALVGGVLLIVFSDRLTRGGGDYNFGVIIPVFGGGVMIAMSLLVIAVRFFG